MTEDRLITATPMTAGKKWLLLVISIIMLLLTSSIIFMPYVIKYGLQQWLVAHGANYAEIEDVDFNPFTGKATITKLISGEKNSPALIIKEVSLRIDWLSLFKNRIYIEDVLVSQAVLNINNTDTGLQVGGITMMNTATKTNEDEPVAFGVNAITILDSKIDYFSQDLRFTARIDHASTGELINWEPAQITAVELKGKINNGQLHFNGSSLPFSHTPSLTGQLFLSALPVEIFNSLLLPETLRAAGGIDADVNIQLALEAGLRERDAATTSRLKTGLDGNISLQDFSIKDTAKQITLWHSDQVSLKDVHIADQQPVVIDQIEIQNMTLAKETATGDTKTPGRPAIAHADTISIQTLQLSRLHDLSIGTVTIQGGTARLHRNAEGEWLTIKEIFAGPASSQETPDGKLTVKIDQMSLADKATLTIHDQSVEPFFQSKIDIEKGVVSSLDSGNPQQVSTIAFSGKVGDYTDFTMSGQVQPFTAKINLDLTGEIKGSDLPTYTSYARRYLGYILKSGHVDSDITIKITNDVIDGNAKLQINNLKITPDDPAKMMALTKQLSMPIETAISMLRDKNNNIHLQVPVTGNINDPNFDYSNAINQAIGKATRTAALSYLKLSLGPFGAAIAIVQFASESSAKIKLEPVKFDAGQSALDSLDNIYIKHIAEILSERPEVSFSICGTAVNQDRITLQQQDIIVTEELLLSLANQRAGVIKQQLVKQYAISAERLFICQPELLTEKDAIPQALLYL